MQGLYTMRRAPYDMQAKKEMMLPTLLKPPKKRSPTGKGMSLPQIVKPAESMPRLRHLTLGNGKKRTTKQYNMRARATSEKQAERNNKLREVNDKRASLIEGKKELTRELIVRKQQRKLLRIKARTWFRIFGYYLSLSFWELQLDSLEGIHTERKKYRAAANKLTSWWKHRNDNKLQQFYEKLGSGGRWRLIIGLMMISRWIKRWRGADTIRIFLKDYALTSRMLMCGALLKGRFKMRVISMQKFATGYLGCTQARMLVLGRMFDSMWEKAVSEERKRLKLARRDVEEIAPPEARAHDKKWSYIDRHLTRKLNRHLDHKIVTSLSWYSVQKAYYTLHANAKCPLPSSPLLQVPVSREHPHQNYTRLPAKVSG
jgi:hypothetical protein